MDYSSFSNSHRCKMVFVFNSLVHKALSSESISY